MNENLSRVIKVRAYSKCHISLYAQIVKDLDIDENDVILYRFVHAKDVYSVGKVIKIRRKRNNQVLYVLSIRKEALQKAKLKLPQTFEIEILDIKKIGYKPSLITTCKNCLDIISLIRDDERFTCFEKPDDTLLIYYMNKKSTSVITLPRFIPLNEFTLWNIGFYIAEGLKVNFHRVSASNDDSYLVSRFVRYLNSWKIIESKISVRIKVKPKNYHKSLNNFWAEKLNLPIENIVVRKTYNKPTNSKYGNAEVTVYNTIFGIIHSKFLNVFINNSEDLTKEEALSIIKGLEEGDGHAILHKGSIEIGITCEKQFTKFVINLYSKIYSEPIIEPHSTSKKVDKILYRGIKNGLKFLEDGHFINSFHRRKNLIFLLSKSLKNKRTITKQGINKQTLERFMLLKEEFNLTGGTRND
jgi:hypothetical protein